MQDRNRDGTTHLPLGPPIDAAAAPRPERTTLAGRFVTLFPLEAANADELYGPSHGPEAEALWAWMGDGPYPDPESFAANIAAKATGPDPFYAVIDNASGRCLGYLSLIRIDQPNRGPSPALLHRLGQVASKCRSQRRCHRTSGSGPAWNSL